MTKPHANPQLGPMIPILRIFDVTKAREFYLGYLGFTVDFEHRFDAAAPLYLGISRGRCQLHLSEHHGDCSPGAKVRIPTGDIDALHGELIAKPYAYYRPSVETMPWNSREMLVIDPFGNKLAFFAQTDHQDPAG